MVSFHSCVFTRERPVTKINKLNILLILQIPIKYPKDIYHLGQMNLSAINPQPVHSAALFCIEFACMLTIVPFVISVAIFMVSNQGSNVLGAEFCICVLFLKIILLFVAFFYLMPSLFNGKFTVPA
jgi:hypothetical protein